MLDFPTLEQCQVIVQQLLPFTHHGIHIPCTPHDQSFAFWFEHFERHAHYMEIPLSRPEELQ